MAVCIRALLLLLPLGLAACAGGADRQASQPRVLADFLAGTEVVEVVARDSLPARSIELLTPDGRAYPAPEVRHATLPGSDGGYYAARPSFGFGVGGGSRSGIGTGVGIGFPIFGGGVSAPPEVESRAAIPVPEIDGYRTNWREWRVRLSFGEGEAARVVSVPAPPPPGAPRTPAPGAG